MRSKKQSQLSKIVLLSGLPAAGKSRLGSWLAQEYGYKHLDLENEPGHETLLEICTNPAAAVARLRESDDLIVLDWGFPPAALQVVEALARSGVQLWWLGGDWKASESAFTKREEAKQRTGAQRISIADFEKQRDSVNAAWSEIARVFGSYQLEVLRADGRVLEPTEIYSKMLEIVGRKS